MKRTKPNACSGNNTPQKAENAAAPRFLQAFLRRQPGPAMVASLRSRELVPSTCLARFFGLVALESA